MKAKRSRAKAAQTVVMSAQEMWRFKRANQRADLEAVRQGAEAVARAADEEGGPSLSLVPATERDEVWPTDLLPGQAVPFDGVPLEDSRKRLAGWSA